MNEHIVTLSKRRSQLKQAITKMVQEAYELVEKTPDLDTKLKLIETLRTVTTGKVRIIIIIENLFILNYSFKDFC
jgi:26S proteasome regulatory subunit N5